MRTEWKNPQQGDTPFQAGLRKFCKRKGLTQKALAEKVGILYYVGFLLMVVNAGDIIIKLIFADEFNLWLIYANIGFLLLGVFEMLYARLRFYYDVQKDDFFVTLLAIENVCDEECASKIRKEASRLYFFMKINQPKFFEWLDKKAREEASKKS